MGLSLCYDLSLPGALSEAAVLERVSALRAQALSLPFEQVSEIVRLTEHELDGPWPLQGIVFKRLEDVVHVSSLSSREELHQRSLGLPEDADGEFTRVDVPPDVPTVVLGFAVAPGRGSEPAAFGLTKLPGAGHESLPWWGQCCCKTQYASIEGNDHMLRCHGSLVALLDAAAALGFELEVHDETGYWSSRDPNQLLEAVDQMNRLVARLAGHFTDKVRDAGGDSRQIQGAIFEHPDFERLETHE